MQAYVHRQHLARWGSVLLGSVVLVYLGIAMWLPGNAVSWVPAVSIALVIAVWWMVSVLIIRVDHAGVVWSFAWGWPGGSLPFDRIERVERTKLNALERSGTGWHWTVWHGWLWNVGGAEAVEIVTTAGTRITLGTDDPQGLVDAIERFRTGAP